MINIYFKNKRSRKTVVRYKVPIFLSCLPFCQQMRKRMSPFYHVVVLLIFSLLPLPDTLHIRERQILFLWRKKTTTLYSITHNECRRELSSFSLQDNATCWLFICFGKADLHNTPGDSQNLFCRPMKYMFIIEFLKHKGREL